ncbi:MAG: TRAP transporter large permease subunit [Bradyrhizobiaceae bacterium]|nr:TRAP transporter large permease subunit [Bradyrhizobiaceae bacterium]
MHDNPGLTTGFRGAASRAGNRLIRSYRAVPLVLSAVASFSIILMMLMICADIGLRFVFNAPIAGVNETVSMLIVVCVFLQLGVTISSGRMIRADLVIQIWKRKRPALASVADASFFALAALMLAIALRWLWNDFLFSYQTNEFAGAVGAYQIATWPFKLATVIGCVVAMIESLRVVAMRLSELHWDAPATAESAPLRRDLLHVGGFFVAVAVAAFLAASYATTPILVGIFMIAALLAGVIIGVPIAFALLVLSFVGMWLTRGSFAVAENSLGTTFSNAIASYEFAVVPLYVIMGLVLDKADVGRDAFQVCSAVLRKVHGALGVATVAANAVFASVTGTSIASASIFSRIAVIPMMENGYTKRFSVGVVAGSSVLGMLIPPSILMIIYGLIAEVSIGKLFIAGIVPGLLLAFAFSLLCIGLAVYFPGFVGTPKEPEPGDLAPTTVGLKLLPVVAIVLVVMGGIYTGVFTPTEAGAVGALASFVVAAARRKLTYRVIREVIVDTAYITAAILFVIITANYYGRMLTSSTVPFSMVSAVSALDVGMWQFLLLYLLIVLLLGMLLDAISIMLVALPLALPIMAVMNADLIWFGIVSIIAVEIGLLTPPFGLAVFVIKGSFEPDFVSLKDIFIGASPFVAVMLIVTLLLMAVPQISLLLL